MGFDKSHSRNRAFLWHSVRSFPCAILIASVLVAAALALGVWHVTRFVDHTYAALHYRYPLDGQEGTLLYEARRLRAGAPLYQPLRPDRVVAAPYPPLHYVALAALELATNPEGAFFDITQQPIFLPGRALSLAAILSVALLLLLAVWRLGQSWLAGLLAACLWLAFPAVQLWATRIKPDTLALAFTALGLCAVAWYLTGKRPLTADRRPPTAAHSVQLLAQRIPLSLICAAVAFTLAFFTKQTAVAAPGATALTLLLVGLDGRRTMDDEHIASRGYGLVIAGRFAPLLTFTGTYALLVAVVWIALDQFTGGQYTFHVWGLHPAEWWSYGQFRKYLNLLLPAWPLLLLALAALLLLVSGQASRPQAAPNAPALAFCFCYALLGALTLVGAGTTGAHHNHLLEPQLALTLAGCSVASISLRRFWIGRPTPTIPKPGSKVYLIALAVLVLQLWLLRERPEWYGGEFDLREPHGERFVALIMSQPGEVLADDVGLLLAAGRPLRYDDPATMGPAARSGLWDQRVLLEEIAARRFSLVLLPFDATEFDVDPSGRWTPEFIAALRQHYRVLYRDVIFSYVPR